MQACTELKAKNEPSRHADIVNAFLNFYENFLFKLKPVVYSLDPSYCSYSDTGTASKFGSGRIRVRDKSIVTKNFYFFISAIIRKQLTTNSGETKCFGLSIPRKYFVET